MSEPPRRRPVVFWLAVALAVATLGAGVTVAALGYVAETGPDGTVRGYFAALTAGDARTALAYGDVPAGPRTLLTATVLREQQRIAPIGGVRVGTVARRGDRASVPVSYRIEFSADSEPVTDTVTLHRADGRWRLDAVAVATALRIPAALRRASIAGAGVPTGDTLLFPGAAPISFDTPVLELRPDAAMITFGAGPTTLVRARVSTAGREAVTDAARLSLNRCYGASASPAALCPLPSERFVPGRLRGTTMSSLDDEISVDVQDGDDGTLAVSGRVRVTGSYARLSFTNVRETDTGVVTVPVRGTAYPVTPVQIRWARTAS